MKTWTWRALGVLSLVVLAGCAKANLEPSAGAPPTSQSLAGGSGSVADTTSRHVIRRAHFEAEDPNPTAVRNRVRAAIEGHGGVLQSSQLETADDVTTLDLEGRVPEEKLEAVLVDLRRCALRITSEGVSSEDATAQVIDLDARLRANEALEQQLLEILKRAANVEETLEVQQPLGQVRAELEQLQAQARLLRGQTQFSTVTIHVVGVSAETGTSRRSYGETFVAAGHDLLRVSDTIVQGGIRLAGIAVPVCLLVALPGYLLLSLGRRVRRWRAAGKALP